MRLFVPAGLAGELFLAARCICAEPGGPRRFWADHMRERVIDRSRDPHAAVIEVSCQRREHARRGRTPAEQAERRGDPCRKCASEQKGRSDEGEVREVHVVQLSLSWH